MIADLSQKTDTRFEGVVTEISDIKTNYNEWQTKAEERLKNLETSGTKFKTDLTENSTNINAKN